ncbi:bacteriocin immunity protein [Streptococcus mitis]|uniref:bacteriocin immunity protein n=1 Tax=Streptococcus mitis TaxID=28037 RepID=UPI0039C0F924
MVESNLESLIKDLYNHARHDLSEDLVAALLETAKKLPTTNEQLLAVRLSGLVNHELLLNPKHPASELLNLARFIKREETKYRGTAASAIMYGELFKML